MKYNVAPIKRGKVGATDIHEEVTIYGVTFTSIKLILKDASATDIY